METGNYMVLGFGVIFGALFLHLLSVHLRNRNLHYELNMLEKVSKKQNRKKTSRRKTSRR
jgi:hypothetical protein